VGRQSLRDLPGIDTVPLIGKFAGCDACMAENPGGLPEGLFMGKTLLTPSLQGLDVSPRRSTGLEPGNPVERLLQQRVRFVCIARRSHDLSPIRRARQTDIHIGAKDVQTRYIIDST
jgi:hypothetical protein